MGIVFVLLVCVFVVAALIGDPSNNYQYTIEIKDCNGEKDTVVIRGNNSEEFYIDTHEEAVPILENMWGKTLAINVCKFRIISKCKLNDSPSN